MDHIYCGRALRKFADVIFINPNVLFIPELIIGLKTKMRCPHHHLLLQKQEACFDVVDGHF